MWNCSVSMLPECRTTKYSVVKYVRFLCDVYSMTAVTPILPEKQLIFHNTGASRSALLTIAIIWNLTKSMQKKNKLTGWPCILLLSRTNITQLLNHIILCSLRLLQLPCTQTSVSSILQLKYVKLIWWRQVLQNLLVNVSHRNIKNFGWNFGQTSASHLWNDKTL